MGHIGNPRGYRLANVRKDRPLRSLSSVLEFREEFWAFCKRNITRRGLRSAAPGSLPSSGLSHYFRYFNTVRVKLLASHPSWRQLWYAGRQSYAALSLMSQGVAPFTGSLTRPLRPNKRRVVRFGRKKRKGGFLSHVQLTLNPRGLFSARAFFVNKVLHKIRLLGSSEEGQRTFRRNQTSWWKYRGRLGPWRSRTLRVSLLGKVPPPKVSPNFKGKHPYMPTPTEYFFRNFLAYRKKYPLNLRNKTMFDQFVMKPGRAEGNPFAVHFYVRKRDKRWGGRGRWFQRRNTQARPAVRLTREEQVALERKKRRAMRRKRALMKLPRGIRRLIAKKFPKKRVVKKYRVKKFFRPHPSIRAKDFFASSPFIQSVDYVKRARHVRSLVRLVVNSQKSRYEVFSKAR